MNHCHARASVLASLMTVAATYPVAAEAELTAKSIEVFAYDTITNHQQSEARPAGFVEIAEMPGHRFLHFRGIFDVPWSEDLSRLSVRTRDMHIILEDGSEIEPMAGFQHDARITLSVPGISLSRPRDFPDADADLYYQALWMVPEDAETVTLRIGGDLPFETELTVPASVAERSGADYAQFDVERVQRYRSVTTEERSPSGLIPLSIVAPENHVLVELSVKVDPVAPNNFEEEPRFNWETHEFHLVDEAGNSYGLIGERFTRMIRDTRRRDTAVGEASEAVMIWGVPETLEIATLLFAGVPVAEVSLGDVPVLPND